MSIADRAQQLYNRYFNPWVSEQGVEHAAIAEEQIAELLDNPGVVEQHIPLRLWDPELNGSQSTDVMHADADRAYNEFQELRQQYTITDAAIAVDEDAETYTIRFTAEGTYEDTPVTERCKIQQSLYGFGVPEEIETYLESEGFL